MPEGDTKPMAERLLSLRGEIIPESEAHISPFDRGFLWGDGVYEVTPLFEGRRHLIPRAGVVQQRVHE